MLDEYFISLVSFLLGGGTGIGIITWLTRDKFTGEEPVHTNERRNRDTHVHHYDTMNPATNGKYACGTCGKVAK